MVTSLDFHSDLYYYTVPFLTNYGTVPYSLFLTAITALLQAVLQENTEALRNGLVEMKNRTAKMSPNNAQQDQMYILA